MIRHALRGGLVAGCFLHRTGAGISVDRHGGGRADIRLPGLGNYFIQASLNRDEPLIIGIVAFIAITLLSDESVSGHRLRLSGPAHSVLSGADIWSVDVIECDETSRQGYCLS